MNFATKKWIFLKISSIILLPLMIWFILNFIAIYNQNYLEVLKFFTNSTSKFLFSLFIIFAYFCKTSFAQESQKMYLECRVASNPSVLVLSMKVFL